MQYLKAITCDCNSLIVHGRFEISFTNNCKVNLYAFEVLTPLRKYSNNLMYEMQIYDTARLLSRTENGNFLEVEVVVLKQSLHVLEAMTLVHLVFLLHGAYLGYFFSTSLQIGEAL